MVVLLAAPLLRTAYWRSAVASMNHFSLANGFSAMRAATQSRSVKAEWPELAAGTLPMAWRESSIEHELLRTLHRRQHLVDVPRRARPSNFPPMMRYGALISRRGPCSSG